MILAADVGGTSTRLALVREESDGGFRLLAREQVESRSVADFAQLAAEFASSRGASIDAVGIGVAGLVLGSKVKATNLPWILDGDAVARALGEPPVRLLNDLEAMAYGVGELKDEDLHWINRGSDRPGNRVVIAAGTGLGQALLIWDGVRHRPVATEGGHADFAPRDETQWQLVEFLLRRHARVSWERVLSGNGLQNVLQFVVDGLGVPPAACVAERLEKSQDVAGIIGGAALSGECAACRRAVELMMSIYGAQAGNLALTAMALGGVFIGGGIARKLRPFVDAGGLRDAFFAKEPFRPLMEQLPLAVILNREASLLGAARAASLAISNS